LKTDIINISNNDTQPITGVILHALRDTQHSAIVMGKLEKRHRRPTREPPILFWTGNIDKILKCGDQRPLEKTGRH